MNTTPKHKIRVGLLVNSLKQRAWVHQMLAQIAESPFAEIALVVVNDTSRKKRWRDRSLAENLRLVVERRRYLLWKLYDTVDERIFKSTPDPFAPTDIRPLLKDCPVIHVTPRETKYSDYLEDEDVEAIKRYDLDVAVRLGFRILRGGVLGVARHGIWSYHHGDNLVNRGGPPCFWEVMEGHPVTGSMLQILSPELDGGKVIYRSWASTDKYSVRRNRENVYRKSSAFLVRKLRDLYCRGEAALQEDPYADRLHLYSQPLYRTPTNGTMVRLLTRHAMRLARAAMTRAFFREQWFLAYRFNGSGMPSALYNFKRMVPPRGSFWADPFPVRDGDRYFIFLEEFEEAEGKAAISVIEMQEDGSWTPPEKVLERAYHLSYPFVFSWNGTYYMVPESLQARRVELYRATRFPYEWTLDRVLLDDVEAVDATLSEIDGLWWMFVNRPEYGSANHDELHLYYAEEPTGPWQPHARNPVKSDVRSSRPAGRLFRWNGDIYRPAQDCSRKYGYGMTLNRIRRLSPTEYAEEVVSKIEPEWQEKLFGTHTLNHDGHLTVIDGGTYRPRFL